eukprot:scaffold3079_cov119-Cylindrotheca_fusiformis.AAC.14
MQQAPQNNPVAGGAAAAAGQQPPQQQPPQQPQQQQQQPQQPVQPPLQPLQQPAPYPFNAPPGHQTYAQFYDDPATEHWTIDVLAQVYQRYDIGGGLSPRGLRDYLYNSGNNRRAVSVLVHIRDPNDAADQPGEIRLCHRLTRYDAGVLGLNQNLIPHVGHGFFGDVRLNGQAPYSVELPDSVFARINQVTQVPDFGLMEQLLNADPDLPLVGPFPAGTADCSPIDSRQAMMVPNWIARMFLHQGMTPREAYTAVYGVAQAAQQEAAVEPLLNWLRLALTRPAADQPPRTAIPPLTAPLLRTQRAMDVFQDYRLNHMLADLQGISPAGVLQLSHVTHQGLATIAHETRLTRLDQAEARNQKAARKKPADYYQDYLDGLLRLVQVGSEDDLPPIHEQLANHTKTQTQRVILQRAVHATLTARQIDSEEFPVTTAMAQKVHLVSYGTQAADTDFTEGLHVFNMGTQDSTASTEQDRLNLQADILYGQSVAPSLDEVAELTSSSKDVYIPRDTDQLRAALERTHAFYETLFGDQHTLVRAIDVFIRVVSNNSRRMKDLLASTGQAHLIPVFAPKVARWFHVEMNNWLIEQRQSPVALPAPDFTQVFRKIRSYDPSWNRPFPIAYMVEFPVSQFQMTSAGSVAPSMQSGITQPTAFYSGTAGTMPPSLAPSSTTTSTTNRPDNSRVRNTAYDNRFERFREKNIKTGTLKANLTSRTPPVQIPRNAAGTPHCLAYHIKGLCNSNCGASADHRPLTEPETTALVTWCDEHYKIVE